MTRRLTRRRFIGISAAAAGLSLLPFGAAAAGSDNATVWRGKALGAPTQLIVHHRDRALAETLVARMASEIARLEGIFSLYDPASSLSLLNASGALAVPPPELVGLLARCRDIHAATGGVFDPTIQPLWMLHANHFSTPDADPAGPTRAQVDAALGLVGFDRVAFGDSRIAFASKGMALTLNGVAQGFITDRIVGMLRNAGITNTLADIGEVRAVGRRGDGSAWRVGIGDTSHAIDLVDRAVATSSAEGFRFAGPGSPTHLLDPRTGRPARNYRNISVVAPDAASADALSTACCFLDPDEVAALTDALPAIEVYVHMNDGRRIHFG